LCNDSFYFVIDFLKTISMNKITYLPKKNPYLLFVKPLITIVVLLLGHYYVAGQQSTNLVLASANETPATTWTFLSGAKKMYYIDFSEVKERLEVIQITSIKGEVLFEDYVADLSNQTFYELNLSKIQNGEYFIELKGKNRVFRKLLKLE